MADETTVGKRGRKAGTPDTVKISIQKLLEIGGDRLVVPVNRKWLEFLVGAYSQDEVVDLTELSNGSKPTEEVAPPLSFEVLDDLD